MSTGASTGGPVSTGMPASTGSPQSTGSGFSWNEGWRDRFAQLTTEPDSERKHLERFESPDQIYRSYRSLTRTMNTDYVPKLKENASPEEVARWREQNNVPGKPEDYKMTVPQGKQAPPEGDAPFLDAFRKSAHSANYTQSQFDQAIQSFYSEIDRVTNATGETDQKALAKKDDVLRQDWGMDYQVNLAMAAANLARAPQGFKDRFLGGRYSDYSLISADPDAWKWLVQMEREINPAATVVPGQTGDLGKSIEKELSELREMQAADPKKYWSEPVQKRERDLLAAQQNLKKKQGAG